jgi:Putative exonuclease SbcCD, C subunit
MGRRDALDVRNRFTFDCAEWDVSSDELIRTHSNAGDNSGGEQEKLMAFCVAGALSFNLASPESEDNKPVFAQLMLDEAFSSPTRSSPSRLCRHSASSAFSSSSWPPCRTPPPSSPTSTVLMVSKREATGRNARPVATVSTKTITDFTALRHEMRTSAKERVPAGV